MDHSRRDIAGIVDQDKVVVADNQGRVAGNRDRVAAGVVYPVRCNPAAGTGDIADNRVAVAGAGPVPGWIKAHGSCGNTGCQLHYRHDTVGNISGVCYRIESRPMFP